MINPIFLVTANSVLEKLQSYAGDATAEEIKGIWYAQENFKKMEIKMAAICAVLDDADQKRYTNEAFEGWLRDLKKVVYAIDDLLDEVATDALQRSVNKGHFVRQARYYISSDPLSFRFELSRKIEDLCVRLDEVEARYMSSDPFGLTEHPVERNPLDTFASNITVPFVYHWDCLSHDECWSIFKGIAFKEDGEDKYPNLYCIGKSIVHKCGGVLLVVKILAGSLHDQRDEQEWRLIEEMVSSLKLDEGHYERIMLALTQTFEKLPTYLKACFAIFSLKGIEHGAIAMSYYWSALGLMQQRSLHKNFELVGDQYIKELLSRCFLQDHVFEFDNTISFSKMHDLLHDLAMKIIGKELAIVTTNDLKEVSELTRHIIWKPENFDDLSNFEFRNEKPKEVRSLRFDFKKGHVSKSFLEGIISNFKCLRILDFNLITFMELPRSVGNLKHLRYLKISNNPLIKVLPSTVCKLVNLQTLSTNSCERLEELPRDIDNLISLRWLWLTTLQESLAGTRFCHLSSLQRLDICNCKNMRSLWDEASAGHLNSLWSLEIFECPKLTSLPNSMRELVSLERLIIRTCQKLDFERGNDLHGLSSLQSLEIQGVPKMVRLPSGIQSAATSLKYLCIESCHGLSALPEYLGKFTSLQRIHIINCSSLLALPQGFRHLNNLQKLVIFECPHLMIRARLGGEDYPYICHVPIFVLDGYRD